MNKYSNNDPHEFQSRILRDTSFMKFARKNGFDPHYTPAPMLYQLYSNYLEGIQRRVKRQTVKAKATPKPKPSFKVTRVVTPKNNINNFKTR